MAYITRNGTKVLNATAARMAIIEEAYHGDDVAEYAVYSYQALKHDMQPGDSILIRNAADNRLEGIAWTVNLTNGTTKLVAWDDMCHAVKPKGAKA